MDASLFIRNRPDIYTLEQSFFNYSGFLDVYVAPEYDLLFRETLCTCFARLAHLDESEATSAFSKCHMNKSLGSS